MKRTRNLSKRRGEATRKMVSKVGSAVKKAFTKPSRRRVKRRK